MYKGPSNDKENQSVQSEEKKGESKERLSGTKPCRMLGCDF